MPFSAENSKECPVISDNQSIRLCSSPSRIMAPKLSMSEKEAIVIELNLCLDWEMSDNDIRFALFKASVKLQEIKDSKQYETHETFDVRIMLTIDEDPHLKKAGSKEFLKRAIHVGLYGLMMSAWTLKKGPVHKGTLTQFEKPLLFAYSDNSTLLTVEVKERIMEKSLKAYKPLLKIGKLQMYQLATHPLKHKLHPAPPTTCAVCLEEKDDLAHCFKCTHPFCEECLEGINRQQQQAIIKSASLYWVKPNCPTCRATVPSGPHELEEWMENNIVTNMVSHRLTIKVFSAWKDTVSEHHSEPFISLSYTFTFHFGE